MESGCKAEAMHRCFLADPARFQRAGFFVPNARFSINFVSWLGEDLPHFETRFTNDELDLTVTVPGFLGRANALHMPFVVSYLSFRFQERDMDVASILAGYRALALPVDSPKAGLMNEPLFEWQVTGRQEADRWVSLFSVRHGDPPCGVSANSVFQAANRCLP